MFKKPDGAIFVIKGGLGNQLFQVAAGMNYSVKYEVPIMFDTQWYGENSNLSLNLEDFNIPINEFHQWKLDIKDTNLYSQKVSRVSNFKLPLYIEKDFTYSEIKHANRGAKFDGYWQSELYFLEIKNSIIKYFRNALTVESVPEINTIHIRRGDFLKLPYSNVHNLLLTSHYKRALEIFPETSIKWEALIENSSEVEPELVTFFERRGIEIISGNTIKEDLSRLCSSERIILANSTFSWWGAFLSESKSVIAPRNWFTPEHLRRNNVCDLFPDGWYLV